MYIWEHESIIDTYTIKMNTKVAKDIVKKRGSKLANIGCFSKLSLVNNQRYRRIYLDVWALYGLFFTMYFLFSKLSKKIVFLRK